MTENKIFDPQTKTLINIDRVIEFIETGNTSPVLVEIDPSNACNHDCKFCISNYIHLPESKNLPTYNKSIMPKDILLNLCKDLIELDVRAINWTGGGEPTVNAYLTDAIEYIGENSNIKMGIFTNGTLLSKFNLIDTLLKYLTWIRISVDAGCEKTYNKIRRTPPKFGWNDILRNVNYLVNRRFLTFNNNPDIGVGFVITPENYQEIVDFAFIFKDINVDYVQYKPEIVNQEREDGIQRSIEFWKKVTSHLEIAKDILGNKFQLNGYKLEDLSNNTYNRVYKKCIGSQIQPCVGADGEVYVCTNLRGYKEYSYGSLYEKSFKAIWSDIINKRKIMDKIENIENFKNCTKLCKANESSKYAWKIYEDIQYIKTFMQDEDLDEFKKNLLEIGKSIKIKHPEFI
jgi:GTP 3',8-cyclase